MNPTQRHRLALLSLLLAAAGCAGSPPLAYPETRAVGQVDRYHGVEVADPYRWLEADSRRSPEVAAWIDEQNRVTERHRQPRRLGA